MGPLPLFSSSIALSSPLYLLRVFILLSCHCYERFFCLSCLLSQPPARLPHSLFFSFFLSSPSSSPPLPVEPSFSKQLVKELSKVAVAAAASIVSRTASGTWWTDDKVLPQLQQFKVAARQREREREWDRRLPGDRGRNNSL